MYKYIDKFNVISKLSEDHDINYTSLLKNYLENYFEAEINVYHPDYICQLLWNNKLTKNQTIDIYNNIIATTLIKKKQNISTLIKKEKFSLKSLNLLIINLNNKILRILNLLNLNNENIELYITKILSYPILVNFIEFELANVNLEYVNDIIKLNYIIEKLSKDDHIWFLKLIGSVLQNNFKDYKQIQNYNIPDKYNKIYEINYIIRYIQNISNIYSFTEKSIIILLNPLYQTLVNKLIICISLCNTSDLLELVTNNKNTINCILQNLDYKKIIMKEFSSHFKKMTSNIINYDYRSMTVLLTLIIFCDNIKILEPYILLIFTDNIMINLVLEVIHYNININIIFVEQIINLLSKTIVHDTFADKYHKFLIVRLLSNQILIKNEKIILQFLLLKFTNKLLNKIKKIINDFDSSYLDIGNYQIISHVNNLNIIITSYANWDINYNQGYVIFNTICDNNIIDDSTNDSTNDTNINSNIDSNINLTNNLEVIKYYSYETKPRYYLTNNQPYNNRSNNLSLYIIDYQIYYNSIYSGNRKILWLLQYGEIEITYNLIDIKLLPIQLMVLELFNKKDNILINEIIIEEFFNYYSNKFKNDIIQSLINGRILNNINNVLSLSKTQSISNNLIDIYINNITINNSIDISNTLAHTKIDIIKSLINHHVKIKSIPVKMLFEILFKEIKQFELTEKLFNNSINIMLKLDYIIIKDELIEYCL
jgi:hypothetical protein